MRVTKPRKAAVTGVLMLSSAGLIGATVVNSSAADPITGTTTTQAHLAPLNNSPVKGRAEVVVEGRNLQVSVDARRLLKAMPHAQHIHFGQQARNECPSVRDDDNHDHRLNTVEGTPAYGPVRVSLTKRGDTSPASTLAVDRFPTAPESHIHYNRDIKVGSTLANKIAKGKAVVVIHGIDYNGNGKYDFRGAGKSELDPALPAEATDPVTCGVLKVQETVQAP
jgi:hypothetical protein